MGHSVLWAALTPEVTVTKYEPDQRYAPRCLYCGKMPEEHPEGECPKSQALAGLTSGGLIGAGIFAGLLGGWAFVATSNTVSACSSALVQAAAQAQCSRASTFHSLGILGIVAAVVLFLAGVIVGIKR
jgi:cobalamin biosynthesis Mg chelatase CobN